MIYVDPIMQHGWKLGRSCHMFADTVEELHAFAGRVGLKRAWFQDGRFPHYDLTVGRHAVAIRLGAKQLGRAEAVTLWRAKGWTRRQLLSETPQ